MLSPILPILMEKFTLPCDNAPISTFIRGHKLPRSLKLSPISIRLPPLLLHSLRIIRLSDWLSILSSSFCERDRPTAYGGGCPSSLRNESNTVCPQSQANLECHPSNSSRHFGCRMALTTSTPTKTALPPRGLINSQCVIMAATTKTKPTANESRTSCEPCSEVTSAWRVEKINNSPPLLSQLFARGALTRHPSNNKR